MTISRRLFGCVLALTMTAIPGFAAATEVVRPKADAPEVWARTELYFGTDRPGNPVTEQEFNNFVDAHVTRLFPDGMTLLSGSGQFRNSSGVLIKEKSYVLILLYPPQLRDANSRVQELRRIYKESFGQESVLRVDSFAFVSF